MPSEITPMVEQSKRRLTRLFADRKIGLINWKIDRDDDQPYDHGERAEIARTHPVDEGADGAGNPTFVFEALIRAIDRPRARRRGLGVDGHGCPPGIG